MLLSQQPKINFEEILQLGKFNISEQELKNISLFLTKVKQFNPRI
jgi:hypothetical protein